MAALFAAFSDGAWAAEPVPDAKLEKVEVTGSNIRRVDVETALPLQVITRQDIDQGGMLTAKDILDRISANQSYGGWTDDLGVGSTLAGYTGASLRGLGAERTLVLLNGRRLAPYALSGGESVDLSGIPVSAIERVEVLKDGASAVYGTDAIGGVINFILRKDYRGFEASATRLAVQQGGGENTRATVAAGWGSLDRDRFNAFVTLDHVRQEPLPARDREFSRTSYLPGLGLDATSGFSFPANIQQPGGFRGGFNPTVPTSGAIDSSCAPPLSFPTALFPLRCQFDYVPLVDNIAESRKTNVVGRLAWQASADHLLFAEGSWYRGDFVYKTSPTPVSSFFTNTPMALPPSSPYYPADFVAGLQGGNPELPLRLNYRLVELGPRINEPEVEQSRFVAGAQGVAGAWDYVLSAGHTANRQVDNYTGGFVSEERFGPLLRSGVVNPFGPNTPEVLEQLRATQVTGPVSDNRASHTGAELKVSSTPWELPTGGLAVALGLEGRREALEQENAEVLYTGDIIGGGGVLPSLTTTTRRVWSLFGEANVPLARSLEANLAVRHDQYSDFGGSTNPKVTLRWQAARNAVLRGSVGTGFRAPTLSDLHLPTIPGLVFGFPDPLRCPVTGAEEDCGEGFYRSKGGGNPDLQPETSRSFNAGIVLEPAKGLSLTLDYYRIRIEDLIVTVPINAIFSDYARWSPTHVFRLPTDPAQPGLAGPIDYILATNVNAGTRETAGFDLDVRYRLPASRWGRFSASLTGTYVTEYEASEFEDAAPGTADLVTGIGAISRWRHYFALDWSWGDWGATLAQTFQLGYDETDLTTCDPATFVCPGRRRVGSLSLWDLQVRYTGVKGLTASAGIRNLFDRDPPTASSAQTFQIGYDPSYADPRGRMVYLTLGYAWR
jgi:iron complex outermembrane receptor protein